MSGWYGTRLFHDCFGPEAWECGVPRAGHMDIEPRGFGAWVMSLDEWIKSRGKTLGGNNKTTSNLHGKKATRGVEAQEAARK